MTESPRFFTVTFVEKVPELVLGTADFVSRPIIILAQEEITQYIDEHKPDRLVINFQNVHHISSEFISALIHIRDHVNDIEVNPRLAGTFFTIKRRTPAP